MKFTKFNNKKTLSLANALYISNESLAKSLKEVDFKYISSIEDPILKNENLIRCEIGSISFVLALLCKFKGVDGEFFDELDVGYLSGECNVGEEEFEELNEWLSDACNIIIDSSFFRHSESKKLFCMLELLGFDVILADSFIDEFLIDDKNIQDLDDLSSFDGSVIYQIQGKDEKLIGGTSFAIASKISDGDTIQMVNANFKKECKFKLDSTQKGTIAFYFSNSIDGYDFKLVKVSKI